MARYGPPVPGCTARCEPGDCPRPSHMGVAEATATCEAPRGVCTLECQRDTLCPVSGGISCVAAEGVPDGTETAQREN